MNSGPEGSSDPDGSGVDDDELEACWAAVVDAVNGAGAIFAQTLQTVGLGPAELLVLTRLVDEPSGRLPMTVLARAVALTSGGLTKLVDRMESNGMLERQPSVTDRRIVFAVLTDGGRECRDAIRPVYLRTLQEVLGGPLGTEGVRQLAEISQTLTRASRFHSRPERRVTGPDLGGVVSWDSRPLDTASLGRAARAAPSNVASAREPGP